MRTRPRRSKQALRRPVAVSAAHQFPGAGYPLDLVGHLGEHLLWMRLRGRRESTLLSRRRACVLLAEWLGHDPITATYDELFEYQAHLALTSVGQVRSQTSLIRPYFAWLHARGFRGDDPAKLLPLPPPRPALPRPIAEPRLSEVIRTARPRLLPWLLLAAWSGLRASEIAELQVEQFTVDELGQRWVRIVGKGGWVRDAPVLAWIWPTIAAALPESGPCWQRERGEGPVTGKQVSDNVCRHLHKQGFPDTLHALRHRAATLLHEASGYDIRLVQQFLGHKNADTTSIYTQVNPRRIAVAADRLPRVALPTDGRLLQVVGVTPDAAALAGAMARDGQTG